MKNLSDKVVKLNREYAEDMTVIMNRKAMIITSREHTPVLERQQAMLDAMLERGVNVRGSSPQKI